MGLECKRLFQEMQQMKLVPTAATFTSLLTGCSHSELVEEGLQFFHDMQPVYSVVPTIEHFNCVVDLLGRANKLEQAEEFILKQISTPNIVTWRTFLGACRIHNDIERAHYAIEKILDLNPNDSSAHAMMASIYSSGNQYKQKEKKLREKMVQSGIKKIPGTTATDIDGVLHTFYVNDTRHKESKAIYEQIKKLKKEMQAVGYIQDVVEEEKREMLWYQHS